MNWLLFRRFSFPLFIPFAVGYLVSLSFFPYPFSVIPKVIPILILAFYALKFGKSFRDRLVLGGLLFSGLGDVLLERPISSFLMGLAAFLIAHLFYAAAFYSTREITKEKLLFMCVVFFSLFGMGIVLTPKLGDFFIPVVIYMAVLGGMALMAGFYAKNRILPLGAFLFIISDTLIALNRFVTPIENSTFYIMLSYFAAQYLILRGYLMERFDDK